MKMVCVVEKTAKYIPIKRGGEIVGAVVDGRYFTKEEISNWDDVLKGSEGWAWEIDSKDIDELKGIDSDLKELGFYIEPTSTDPFPKK